MSTSTEALDITRTKKEALTQSKPLLSHAQSLIVEDEAGYVAADSLRARIKESRKVFWDRITKAVTPAYQALQELYAIRNDLTKPLDEADEAVTTKMKEFKRREAVRIAAEQRERERQAEKLRQEAEEKRKKEEAAKTPAMQARIAVQREKLEEQAAEVEARESGVVKAAHSGTRTVTKIRVVNKMALVKAIAAGDIPDELVDVDTVILTAYFKQEKLDKESAAAIGCEIYEDIQIVGRR